MIIEVDTRNQKDRYVTDYFDKQGIKWIRNKLYAGDVKVLDSSKIIIDLKKDLLELAGNLCKTSEHERIRRELARASEIGCEDFIFLVKSEKIKNEEDIKKWSSKYSQVRGETLLKIMKTMKEKYGCRFIFTSKKNAGAMVVKILKGEVK